MKVFQIVDGFCWWDATDTVRTLKQAEAMFPPDVVFVEAPDNVREGWVYDEHEQGDARFIRPEAPEGWAYDDKTGTFYELPKEKKGGAK